MTQEYKNLLLKDLCCRLPYGVKVQFWNHKENKEIVDILYNIDADGYCNTYEFDSLLMLEDVKPYLFPMSSITEEQEKELKNMYYSFNGLFHYTERIFDKIPFGKMKYFPYQIEEFFNKNHIDYRGLIDKGLAIDATNKNIYRL